MNNPTVRDIVKRWLIANGYDGLYTAEECACLVDDLMPCDGEVWACEAGYRTECNGGDECPLDGDCTYHVSGSKEQGDHE